MTPDPLLDAIFQPGEESFRGALKAARRRRVRRLLVPLAAGAACVGLTVHLLQFAPTSTAPQAASQPVVRQVHSRPLGPREIVHSTRASVGVISTSELGMRPAGVEDSELLASFEGGRAALVGIGTERRLIQF